MILHTKAPSELGGGVICNKLTGQPDVLNVHLVAGEVSICFASKVD